MTCRHGASRAQGRLYYWGVKLSCLKHQTLMCESWCIARQPGWRTLHAPWAGTTMDALAPGPLHSPPPLPAVLTPQLAYLERQGDCAEADGVGTKVLVGQGAAGQPVAGQPRAQHCRAEGATNGRTELSGQGPAVQQLPAAFPLLDGGHTDGWRSPAGLARLGARPQSTKERAGTSGRAGTHGTGPGRLRRRTPAAP